MLRKHSDRGFDDCSGIRPVEFCWWYHGVGCCSVGGGLCAMRLGRSLLTMETGHVGAHYVGTAVSFTMVLTNIANLVAPPTGNSLAGVWSGAPFAFWSLLAVFGLVCLSMVK